jgi:hypothetical protein
MGVTALPSGGQCQDMFDSMLCGSGVGSSRWSSCQAGPQLLLPLHALVSTWHTSSR